MDAAQVDTSGNGLPMGVGPVPAQMMRSGRFEAIRKEPDESAGHGEDRNTDRARFTQSVEDLRFPMEWVRLRGDPNLCDTLTQDEAKTLARTVNTVRAIADEGYGIAMPPQMDLYIYHAPAPDTRISIFTDAWNTFWVKMRHSKEESLSNPMMPVANNCQELCHTQWSSSTDRDRGVHGSSGGCNGRSGDQAFGR